MNSKTDAGQDGTPDFYECGECGAVFASKDELDSHMIETSHFISRKYECESLTDLIVRDIHKAIAG
ncbi:MAG: Zinc finger, C2H2 [archaeon GW2011_AR5]|nr:MAG: Zinc finger, C2H2 [archaeon GW2011_AR5]